MSLNAHHYTHTDALSKWRSGVLRDMRAHLKDNACSWTAKTTNLPCRSLMSQASSNEANRRLDTLMERPFDMVDLEPVLHAIAPLALCKRWHREYADELSQTWCKAAARDRVRRISECSTAPRTTTGNETARSESMAIVERHSRRPAVFPRSQHRDSSDQAKVPLNLPDRISGHSTAHKLDRTITPSQIRKKVLPIGITTQDPALLRSTKHNSRHGHCRVVGFDSTVQEDVKECPVCYNLSEDPDYVEPVYVGCTSCHVRCHLHCMSKWAEKFKLEAPVSCVVCREHDFKVIYTRTTPEARTGQIHAQEVTSEPEERLSRKGSLEVIHPPAEGPEVAEQISCSARSSSSRSPPREPRRSGRERRRPERFGFD